jgi:uncharacterized membrane protein
MSDPDPSKILFSSRYGYFLNKSTADGLVNLTAQSITAGHTANFSLSIPTEGVGDFTQIKLNFSHDPNNWYIFPCSDVTLDANFDIAVRGSYSGSSLDLAFYVVNQTGSTHTSTATTLSARVYSFEPPV